MTDKDDLMKRVEEAGRALESWPQKDLELSQHLPAQGLCSVCYLAGLFDGYPNEQRPHIVIVLCPRPGGLSYRHTGGPETGWCKTKG